VAAARRDPLGGLLDLLLDFVFPARCAGCGRGDGWLCDGCRQSASPAPRDPCAACGRPGSVRPCPMCDVAGAPDRLLAGHLLEGPLREAVHRFKYGDRPQLARPLAGLMGPVVDALPGGALVPVPLHPRRRRQRGYNQAELLARELADRSGRGLWLGLVRRRETAPQVGQSGEARRARLEGAFAVTVRPPREVVLVDDVVTTGATLLAAAAALQGAGAARVIAIAATLG